MKSLFSIFVLTVACLLICLTNALSQWIATGGTTNQLFLTLSSKDSYLFAGGSNGAYRSTDNGLTWAPIDSGFVKIGGAIFYPSVHSFAVSGSNLYAGTDNGVFVSTDNGSSWSSTGLSPQYHFVQSILFCQSHLFAAGITAQGSPGGGVQTIGDLFVSTDNGANWSPSSTGMPTNRVVVSLVRLGTSLFAGTYSGVYRSDDIGLSWNKCNPYGSEVNSFATDNLILIGGCRYGSILVSADTGKTWAVTRIDSTSPLIGSVALAGENLLAGTMFWGVYLSSDNGASWRTKNEGLGSYPAPSLGINALAIFGDYLFAATDSGIWRRPLSQLTSYVEREPPLLRKGFSLEQNFPNPCNPKTQIIFQIPAPNYTTLEIYDMLGRHVNTLISKYLITGKHTLTWDASSVPNGIYFYRLSSGPYASTKKLAVIK